MFVIFSVFLSCTQSHFGKESNLNLIRCCTVWYLILVYTACSGLSEYLQPAPVAQLDAGPTGDQKVASSIPMCPATFFHGELS